MKTLKTKIFILAITLFTSSILFISCSKKDEAIVTPIANPYPVENFLNGFLTTTGFDQQTTNQISTSGYYNMGVAFKPKVNGTINSITIKLPSSDGGVVVRIWKVSTQALLKTIPVVVATNNLEVTTLIDKLPLLKDEEYVITMRVNSWFERQKTSNGNINYPIEVNNIKITGTTNTNINIYPGINNNITGSIYFGDISFNFQQTE